MEKLEEMFEFKKTYLGKSETTSGNCYLMTIKNKKRGTRISFRFYDNYRNQSGLIDGLDALLSDAYAYDYCWTKDVWHFMREYGYTSYKEAEKVFNGCKKQFERMNKLLDDEELKLVKEKLQEIM